MLQNQQILNIAERLMAELFLLFCYFKNDFNL
jgi:hypothetical protein